MPQIEIKYFTDAIERLTYIDGKSDWIDLRASEEVTLKAGEFCLIPLGVAMELPEAMRRMWYREAPLSKITESSRRTAAALSMAPTAGMTICGGCRSMRCATR